MAIIKIVQDHVGTEFIFDVKRINRLKIADISVCDMQDLGKQFSTVILSDKTCEEISKASELIVRVITFEAALRNSTFDLVITDCPAWVMNDEGKTIERIN